MAEKTTFIKLDRNICRWRWYQNPNTFRVFVHLILNANIKDHDFEHITIHRGQLVTSYKSLAKELGISYKMARASIGNLVGSGELAITRHSKFLVVTVINYDSYQAGRAITGQSQGNHSAIKGQQSKNNKNDKNEKNPPPAPEGGQGGIEPDEQVWDSFGKRYFF